MAEDSLGIKCIAGNKFYEEVRNEKIKEIVADVKENVAEKPVEIKEEIKNENVDGQLKEENGMDNLKMETAAQKVDISPTNIAAEDEERRYEKMTAEELFIEGKDCFKNKNFERAADLLSRATEKKVYESNSYSEGENDICTYYLWYADALLTKEENNNSLFDLDATNQLSSASKPEMQAEEEQENDELLDEEQRDEDVSDEQLAFEIFELARKSYREKIALEKQKLRKPTEKIAQKESCKEDEADQIEKSEEIILKEEEMSINLNYLNDLSYIHMRLGDIQLLNDFFSEAADEYREAYKIRKRNVTRFGIQNIISPTISLAQATLFSGRKKEALEIFQESLELVDEALSNYEKKEDEDEKYNNLLESKEDLDIQIKELKAKIAEEESSGNVVEGVKGSQYDIKGSMITTTSTFDKSRLPENSSFKKIKIISCGEAERTKENNEPGENGSGYRCGTTKKRKIDLTKLIENENSSVSSTALYPTTTCSTENVNEDKLVQNTSFAAESL